MSRYLQPIMVEVLAWSYLKKSLGVVVRDGSAWIELDDVEASIVIVCA